LPNYYGFCNILTDEVIAKLALPGKIDDFLAGSNFSTFLPIIHSPGDETYTKSIGSNQPLAVRKRASQQFGSRDDEKGYAMLASASSISQAWRS
jgi:hypothetical protein